MSDDNDNMMSGPLGFLFGENKHQRDVKRSLSRIHRAGIETMKVMYEEQYAEAERWNALLNDADVTLEMCVAGMLRNSAAARTAKKLSKNSRAFAPADAHEWSAKAHEHEAAFQRWSKRVGEITGVEHSHEPELVVADDA